MHIHRIDAFHALQIYSSASANEKEKLNNVIGKVRLSNEFCTISTSINNLIGNMFLNLTQHNKDHKNELSLHAGNCRRTGPFHLKWPISVNTYS